jgi:hypothetical protein
MSPALDESKLHTAISKEDTDCIRDLKIARINFDQSFPNGPPPGILSINKERRNVSRQSRHSKEKTSSREKQANTAKETLGSAQPTRMNRSIENLRMTLVLTTFTRGKGNNQPNGSLGNQTDDSDPEDELFGFNVDDVNDHEDFIEGTLTQHDLLHGYIHDESYNPAEMEDDGVYPEDFTWSYENVPAGGIQEEYYHYDGPGPSLRHNVSNKFSSVLEACGVAGGLTYQLIK